MAKIQYKVSLSQKGVGHSESNVVKWFTEMTKKLEPIATIEEENDGSRGMTLILGEFQTKTPIPTYHDNETAILHTLLLSFEFTYVEEGAFYCKFHPEDFDDFKSYFVVEEIK